LVFFDNPEPKVACIDVLENVCLSPRRFVISKSQQPYRKTFERNSEEDNYNFANIIIEGSQYNTKY